MDDAAERDDPVIPETAQMGRTALTVADLDETVAFYQDAVGLAVRARSERAATLGAGGSPVLELLADADAPPRGRTQTGLFHNAFRVPSRTALGAALERIRDRGELDGASDHYVSEALYCTDPEGNGVEIYADRPREEWPRADDESVEIGTAPLDLNALVAESDGAAEAPPETDLGHVHLEVSSLGRVRAFYADTLGLGVRTEARGASFLAAGDYHHHVGVNTWNGRTDSPDGRGLAWFEFLLPDAEAVTTARRRLSAADVPVTDREGGFELTGPDGIAVRFRARAARES
ncbi:glyoxalase/bleomycin resistance protein/dioxygenase [Halosimplex carlsbadense 2-9-1]|uniref:Glyoxalase/bleomycin resistance protein/dioxygenase n=1 Tax=Halosimplex carlsbadense 2-9-1 TaxID=797114 RepID=M0CY72_9EURY|nr:VOC family protein [Halosimplex carlsbadense]ELZ27558.1 glyoxalase/bleomycin resistance protein/dioxygenase [Halosimplex carlsbadense 2-9-1]